jgi:hypothetical protein
MKRFTIMPYVFSVENEQWSIPDSIMAEVWDHMCLEKKAEVVFWGGGITNTHEFLKFMKEDKNFPLLVIDVVSLVPVMVAWLNGIEMNHAIGHFCSLEKYDPEMAKTIIEFWKNLEKPDHSKMFNVLLGFIPETNDKAIKNAIRIGFTNLGTIPGMCSMAYNNNIIVGASVLYYDLR